MGTSSTLKVGECKPFCAQSSDSWSFKCSWDCCGGCPSCATMTASSTATVTTTSTTTLTTTGTTTTATDQAGSTTPLPRVCKSWCAGRAQPWAKKCRWEKCGGCAECGPPGRRLAAERRTSERFPFCIDPSIFQCSLPAMCLGPWAMAFFKANAPICRCGLPEVACHRGRLPKEPYAGQLLGEGAQPVGSISPRGLLSLWAGHQTLFEVGPPHTRRREQQDGLMLGISSGVSGA